MESWGEFTIERELGRGATARVVAGRRGGELFALKLFHPGFADRSELERRAQSELRALTALKHPNIVRVEQARWDIDPPGLVMELVEGESLDTLQQRLPYILPEVSVLIALEVLSGLEHAHAQGVVHRDLKPANILVSRAGRIVVTDFGLAKITDASRHTATGTILGSPDFMSPEQASGDRVGVQSDVFSTASILYFLWTGTRPFKRHSPLATLAAVISGECEPVTRRNPKVPPRLAAILERAMAKNPRERFSDARSFAQALRDYLEVVGLKGEAWTFAHWVKDPSGFTMEALRTIAESVTERAEKAADSREVDEAWQWLSHLSLVAPESGSIPRLASSIEDARAKSGRKVGWVWVQRASGVLGLGLLIGGGWWVWKGRVGDGTAVATAPAVVAPVAPAPQAVAPPVAQPPVISPAPAPAAVPRAEAKAPRVEQPKVSRVSFDIPEDIQVFWDGKPVNSKDGVPPQTVGSHKVRFVKAGFAPIEQVVQVQAGEPTVIRVH